MKNDTSCCLYILNFCDWNPKDVFCTFVFFHEIKKNGQLKFEIDFLQRIFIASRMPGTAGVVDAGNKSRNISGNGTKEISESI